MEDNKMCNIEYAVYKPTYRCAVCNTEHKSIAERIKCETACLTKQEEEAKKAAEAKKKAEQGVRKKELDDAIRIAYKLYNAYVKDYGVYEFYCDLSNDNENNSLFWPSKFLHNLLF